MNHTKKITKLAFVSLMTAFICVTAPVSFSIPFSPVPISLGLMSVCVTVCILGRKQGTLSVLLYLLLGSFGVPVFSSWTGGFQKLAGPTGGYLIGYIFCALLAGLIIEKFGDKLFVYVIAMAAGTLVCYAFGTAWLAVQMKLSFLQALMMGVVPYLPADLVKIAVSAAVGLQVKKGVAGFLAKA